MCFNNCRKPETLNLNPVSYNSAEPKCAFENCSVPSVFSGLCVFLELLDLLRKPNNLIWWAAFLHKRTLQWRWNPSPLAAKLIKGGEQSHSYSFEMCSVRMWVAPFYKTKPKLRVRLDSFLRNDEWQWRDGRDCTKLSLFTNHMNEHKFRWPESKFLSDVSRLCVNEFSLHWLESWEVLHGLLWRMRVCLRTLMSCMWKWWPLVKSN